MGLSSLALDVPTTEEESVQVPLGTTVRLHVNETTLGGKCLDRSG